MELLKTRFSRKLHVAFAFLQFIILELAWYFYDSMKWYEHDVQRIAMANDVLQGYQEVSILTFRELNALGEMVVRGDADKISDRGLGAETLRQAISRLRQVFAILIDNVMRYSKEGGSIEIELTWGETDVHISFRGQDIGLTEEEAEQAFERFYRGNKSVEHARGTGLGLPVAKAIVEAHKGKISLEGELGTGAIARVSLPAENRLRVVA